MPPRYRLRTDYELERCERRKAKGLCPILLRCQCPSASTPG